MRIAIGADHAGFALKGTVLAHLTAAGYEVLDCGPASAERVDYPDYAVIVARSVAAHTADLGILVCGTGIGMAMTANRIPGVRGAVCTDAYTARASREHNDANVLCLGARVVGEGVALSAVDAFISSRFAGGRHAERVRKMTALEPK